MNYPRLDLTFGESLASWAKDRTSSEEDARDDIPAFRERSIQDEMWLGNWEGALLRLQRIPGDTWQ